MKKKYDFYAEGGSLGNHGLKYGDQIIKTMSGGVQKVKTKTGDIVYVNLANGYRGAVPPLPFGKGGGVDYEYDAISYAKTKGKESVNWDKELREYAGSQYSKLTAREKEEIISDMQKDWDSSHSYATGGGINWHRYPTKKVSGLYEIKGGEINRKVNIVGFERYDDDLYSLYPLDRDRDIFKEIFVKSTSLNSLDKGVSVKGETNDGKKVSIKRISNQDFSYAEGGVTKNYVQRKELNTITIKKGDQKLTYKVSDVYNGAYKLEDGGNLQKTAFYVPKRNVVKVQLRDGKDVKVANGYWIKKGAKPIRASKFEDGGFMADVYADGGSVERKVDELYEKSTFINDDYNWKSKLLEMLQDNSIEAYNIYQSLNNTQKEEVLQELYEMDNDFGSEGDGDIETSKENLSYLLDDAKNGKKYANGGVIGKEMTFYRHGEEEKGIIGEVNEDGSYNVSTKYSIILVEPQDVISIKDSTKKKGFFFEGGGKTTFKQKATAIAKNFEGKKVEPKYQKEYGKTYDKAEAKEVGNKIAGSQKANQKMATGGGISNKLTLYKSNYLSTENKQVLTSKNGKDIYIYENEILYDSPDGKTKGASHRMSKLELNILPFTKLSNQKMSTGGKTKRGGSMQLAKQIRKEGESWGSAIKRANEQIRNK